MSSVTKAIAFILAVVSFTVVIVQLQYAIFRDVDPKFLLVEEYKDSEDYMYYLNDAMQTVVSIAEGSVEPQDSEFYYYISDGVKTYSNTKNTEKSFYEQYDSTFYWVENGFWSRGKNAKPSLSIYTSLDNKYTVYFAIPDEFMTEMQKKWDKSRTEALQIFLSIMIGAIVGLGIIIYLIIVTGRKSQDKELHLSRMDDIYSDVLLFAMISIFYIWIYTMYEISYQYRYQLRDYGNIFISEIDNNQIYLLIFIGIFSAVAIIFDIIIFLSLVRKIKARKLIKNSIIYKFMHKISSMISEFFKYLIDGSMFKGYPLTKVLFNRQLIFISTSAVLVFFTLVFISMESFIFLLFPMLEIVLIYLYLKGNKETYANINKGFSESLEEQMKAERMKVALITNVSHDLKTPLTSIISYIDLLSKEDLPETSMDFVKILSDKSNRLKNIVSDLFDLAKSSSGDMVLDFENLDLKKLIEQTLADMGDKIEQSELQIKTKLPDQPVNICSDGKKLYRIFQNIIDNALKYSLTGTRVFVEMEDKNGKAIATVKNIAGYEMNFTADEILQRFNRGDKSRTTEGSGLGLSIAESFTKVCGGDLQVDIDGDLFKVTISFPLSYKV